MFKTIAIGNITDDAKVKTFQDGSSVINFTLAVNRKNKNGESIATFLNCSWSVESTKVASYLTKGKKIAVEISWYQNKKYKDSYFQTFYVSQLEFLGGGSDSNSNAKPALPPKEDFNQTDLSDMEDDDLPF